MARRLLQNLQLLHDGFGSVASTPGAASRLHEVAEEVQRAVNDDSIVPVADPRQLSRHTVALAGRLAALDTPQFASISVSGAPAAVPIQIQAAGLALEACAVAAQKLDVQPNDRFWVAAAARLILHAGRATLALQCEAARGQDPATPELERHLSSLLAPLATIVTQLSGKAAAAFAATVAQPHIVLPWLSIALEALALMQSPTGADEVQLTILQVFAQLANEFLTAEAYSRVSQAVAGSPAVQHALLHCLLHHAAPCCLAALESSAKAVGGSGSIARHGSGEQHNILCSLMHDLVDMLTANCLRPALEPFMSQGGAALVRQAARILGALPASTTEASGARLCPTLHTSAARLLAQMGHALFTAQQAAGQQGSSGSSAHGGCSSSATTATSLGSSSSGSSSTSSGGPGATASAGADLAGIDANTPPHLATEQHAQQEAAWEVLGLMPHIAGLLKHLASADDSLVQDACGCYAEVLELADRACSVCSLAQLVLWAAAAEAGVRLLPLLAHLDTRYREEGSQGGGKLVGGELRVDQAAHLAQVVLNVWYRQSVAAASWAESSGFSCQHGAACSSQDAAPSLSAAFFQLWQLHSTGCRVLHWIVSIGSHGEQGQNKQGWQSETLLSTLGESAGANGGLTAWHAVLDGMNCQVWTCHWQLLRELSCSEGTEQIYDSRAFAALCAAHGEAAKAAAAAFGRIPALQPAWQFAAQEPQASQATPSAWDVMLGSPWFNFAMAACAAGCTAALEPQLLQMLQASCQLAPLNPGLAPMPLLLRAAREEPRLAAGLAASGVLGAMLDNCRRHLLRARHADAAGDCTMKCCNVLAFLRHTVACIFGSSQGSEATLAGSVVGLSSGSSGSNSNSSGSGSGSSLCGSRPYPPAEAAVQEGQAMDQLWQAFHDFSVASHDAFDSASTVLNRAEWVPGHQYPAVKILADALQSLLQPAAQLAAALQRYWQLSRQHADMQLQLAQVAATRSCAYLRCDNVEFSGGPAAGPGLGAKKCSGCRAVWYCSTACQHADWRQGGHKRGCQALAAVRQAQHPS